MKTRFYQIIVVCVMCLTVAALAFALWSSARAQNVTPEAASVVPISLNNQTTSDLPGWPTPEKPIPHHEPGHLSRADSYTTQVLRENEVGVPRSASRSAAWTLWQRMAWTRWPGTTTWSTWTRL